MRKFIDFVNEKRETFDEFIVKWLIDNKIIDLDDYSTEKEGKYWVLKLDNNNCPGFLKATNNGRKIKQIPNAPYKYLKFKKVSGGCIVFFEEIKED